MRRLLPLLLLALPLHAEIPALLAEAVQKFGKDNDRWAYTESIVQKDEKGRDKQRTTVRFDPSKPYTEQYTPLEIDGKPPTESQLKKYRAKGQKRGTNIDKAEREDAPPKRKSVGELMDLDHATVKDEDAVSVTYEVPFIKEGNTRFPPEKFLVLARVSKPLRALEGVDVKLRESMRAAFVVKIKSGEATFLFKPADPKFAPPLTSVRAHGSASILFVPFGGSVAADRTDFKRVKPYGDRFEVQIGPLKALDF